MALGKCCCRFLGGGCFLCAMYPCRCVLTDNGKGFKWSTPAAPRLLKNSLRGASIYEMHIGQHSPEFSVLASIYEMHIG